MSTLCPLLLDSHPELPYREERSTSRKAVEAPWGPREGRIQKVEEQGFRPYSDL